MGATGFHVCGVGVGVVVGVGDDGFWRGTLSHSHVGIVGEATGGDGVGVGGGGGGDEGVGGAGAGVFGSGAGIGVDGLGVGPVGVEGVKPPPEHSSLLQSTGCQKYPISLYYSGLQSSAAHFHGFC